MGSTYKRGSTYWLRYSRHGREIRESSRSTHEADAKRLLKKREGEIAEGRVPGVYFDRIRFEELAADFLADYRINGRRSISKAARSVKYLSEAFGGMRVPEITAAKVQNYVVKRLEAGFSNASINRELSALKKMFHLGQRCKKVHEIPFIAMLREAPPEAAFSSMANLWPCAMPYRSPCVPW